MAGSWWSADFWVRWSARTSPPRSSKRSPAGASTSTPRETEASAPQAEYVRHVVETRRLGRDPTCRANDAAREDLPAAGAVRQLDALGGPREHHGVPARDVAATQCCKPDVARPARPGVAVAHALALGGELDPAAARRSLAQRQRGSRGGVDLVAVVHLQHLDVEVLAQHARRLLDQARQQI